VGGEIRSVTQSGSVVQSRTIGDGGTVAHATNGCETRAYGIDQIPRSQGLIVRKPLYFSDTLVSFQTICFSLVAQRRFGDFTEAEARQKPVPQRSREVEFSLTPAHGASDLS